MSGWMWVACRSRPLAGRHLRVEGGQGRTGRLGPAGVSAEGVARQRFEFAALLSRRRIGISQREEVMRRGGIRG